MPKYKVTIDQHWPLIYLVDAADKKDAEMIWAEGDLMSIDWDLAEYDVVDVEEVDDVQADR